MQHGTPELLSHVVSSVLHNNCPKQTGYIIRTLAIRAPPRHIDALLGYCAAGCGSQHGRLPHRRRHGRHKNFERHSGTEAEMLVRSSMCRKSGRSNVQFPYKLHGQLPSFVSVLLIPLRNDLANLW